MSTPKNNKVLPTPKITKSQLGPRFVIASKQSVIKPLNKNIIAAFKLLNKFGKKYCNKNKFYCGANLSWVIQNNELEIYILNKLVIEKQLRPAQLTIFWHYIPTQSMMNYLKH